MKVKMIDLEEYLDELAKVFDESIKADEKDAVTDDTCFSITEEGEKVLNKKKEENEQHYHECVFEPIVLMQSILNWQEMRGFLLGNILKYRLRAGHKDNADSDIKKAMQYEKWLKEWEECGVLDFDE